VVAVANRWRLGRPADRASICTASLSEMEVPQRFIEFMMDTTSAEIRWLTNDEAESMEEVPSIAEWLAATCGAMTKSKTARETSKKR
jgi:hypothetical protein